MRETRTSGSEGGGTDWSSLPLSLWVVCLTVWFGTALLEPENFVTVQIGH